MPKYITAPNGDKLQIVEDKRSASGYRAVPVNPIPTMPLSLKSRDAFVKKAFGQAAEDARVRKAGYTVKSSGKTGTNSKTSRKK